MDDNPLDQWRGDMEEKIMTLHPEQGKSGVTINKRKYDTIREAILESLGTSEEMTFTELNRDVHGKLEGGFDGSISWYVTTVKLDLEARRVIERVPGSSPQRLRMV
jgi:porphobilinogen deaminase